MAHYHKHPPLSRFLVLLSVLLTSCNLPIATREGQDPVVANLVEPEDGQVFPLGRAVHIEAYIESYPGIEYYSLIINGQVWEEQAVTPVVRNGHLVTSWHPASEGKYELQLVLRDLEGATIPTNTRTIHVKRATPTPDVDRGLPIGTFTPTRPPSGRPITPTKPLGDDAVAPVAVGEVDANCRVGPGTGYPVMNYLERDEEADIIGVNEDGSWWLIQPRDTTLSCWISASTVAVKGNMDAVPYVAPPPTPTPTTVSLPTPNLSAPVGGLIVSCGSTVMLSWAGVSHPDVGGYEYTLQKMGSGGSVESNYSAQTTATSVEADLMGCAASYRWRVRVVVTNPEAYHDYNIPSSPWGEFFVYSP